MAVTAMAKKKSIIGRPKSAEGEQRTELTAFRCTPAYKEWMVGLAAQARLSIPDALDAGLVEFARKIGYPEPPKR